jgi:hypothetical protein
VAARRPAGIQVAKIFAGEKHAPLVYFALMGVQQVKVGTSTNLRRRMASFYRSLEEDVVLAVPGDEREESAFHEKFASRVDLDGRPELFWVRGPRNAIPPPAVAVLTGVALLISR